MKKIIPALIFSLAMTGCATIKVSPEYRQQLDQTQQSLKQAPVTILANSCMLTNELGRDQILVTPSYLSAEKFNKILIEQLAQNGVQVSQTASPLICGAMPEEQFKKYDVKSDQKAKRTATSNYPLQNPQNTEFTQEQQNALLQLNQFLIATANTELSNQQNKKSPQALPVLSEDVVNTLKNWSNSRYIFLTSVDGLKASFGNKLTTSALTVGLGVATFNLGSTFFTAYTPKEGQFYSVRIFDLEKKNVVWHKGGIIKGDTFTYKNNPIEVDDLLFPLFEKKAK